MVTGEAGRDGLAAPRHVGLEKEAGQETVTTQPQLMEAATVRDQAQSLEPVTPITVQVGCPKKMSPCLRGHNSFKHGIRNCKQKWGDF